MNKPLLITLGILNIPCYGMFASVLFGRDGMVSAIRYAFIPDIISALKGEYIDDRWSELMLMVWVALSAGTVLSEYTFIKKHLPALFSFFASFGSG
jgi:hypothetical protein